MYVRIIQRMMNQWISVQSSDKANWLYFLKRSKRTILGVTLGDLWEIYGTYVDLLENMGNIW